MKWVKEVCIIIAYREESLIQSRIDVDLSTSRASEPQQGTPDVDTVENGTGRSTAL